MKFPDRRLIPEGNYFESSWGDVYFKEPIDKWLQQFKQMLQEINDQEATAIELAEHILKEWLD